MSSNKNINVNFSFYNPSTIKKAKEKLENMSLKVWHKNDLAIEVLKLIALDKENKIVITLINNDVVIEYNSSFSMFPKKCINNFTYEDLELLQNCIENDTNRLLIKQALNKLTIEEIDALRLKNIFDSIVEKEIQ